MSPLHGSRGENDPDGSGRPSAFASVVDGLIAAGKTFHSRNWVRGTAGSFSAILSRHPFQLVITGIGAHKGRLTPADFLQVNELGESSEPGREQPLETPIHRAIILEREVQAVLHTNSVWSTMLSDLYASAGGLTAEDFEMLKGLSSIKTHKHMEYLPIVENSQDYLALSRTMAEVLNANRGIHGILLRRCGLYTWGNSVAEAVRHVEILEFILEVLGRRLHILSEIAMRGKTGNPI